MDNKAIGILTVSIDGKVVEIKELKDRVTSITVNNLAAGNHNISVSYSGDDKYAPISQNTTLNINELVKPANKLLKRKLSRQKLKLKNTL